MLYISKFSLVLCFTLLVSVFAKFHGQLWTKNSGNKCCYNLSDFVYFICHIIES